MRDAGGQPADGLEPLARRQALLGAFTIGDVEAGLLKLEDCRARLDQGLFIIEELLRRFARDEIEIGGGS